MLNWIFDIQYKLVTTITHEYFFCIVRLFVVMARRTGRRIWPEMFRRNMGSEHRTRFLVFTDAIRRKNAQHAGCLYAPSIHIVLHTHFIHEQHPDTQYHGHYVGVRTMLYSYFCHTNIRWHTAVARHSNNSVRTIPIHHQQPGCYCVGHD